MTISALDPRQQYEAEGFVVYWDVLDAGLIAEVSDHVAWLHRTYPDRRGEHLSTDLVARDPFWVRLVSDDRLLDIAETFVGPDIALFASHYISKPPFSGKRVLWHQDGAYWPLEPMRVVSLWLAVDESSAENGCLRVIPASHKGGLYELEQRPDAGSVLGSESAVAVDEAEAVDLALKPGDVEVHHPNILHGSEANTSPKRRCGLTIRYIPTSTRILGEEQPWKSALLLRGDAGVNSYQPWPVYAEGSHFPFRGAERWRRA